MKMAVVEGWYQPSLFGRQYPLPNVAVSPIPATVNVWFKSGPVRGAA